MDMQKRTTAEIKRELRDSTALIRCAEEFDVMGDVTRLKICWLLCRHRELTVGDIAEIVGVSVSAVSHTLKKLQHTDVVARRREFRNVYYRLTRSPFAEMLVKRLARLGP